MGFGKTTENTEDTRENSNSLCPANGFASQTASSLVNLFCITHIYPEEIKKPPSFDLETEVEPLRGVCERANRDHIHACFCVQSKVVQCYASGCLEHHTIA